MAPQKVVYIYPDVAFAVSLIMNFLILWVTSRLIKTGTGLRRITAGAVYGAMYSFAAAFPHLDLLQKFWLKVPFSLSMVALVFLPVVIKRFAVITAVFYMVSLSLGGFFIGTLYFFSTNPFYESLTDLSGLIAKYFYPGLAFTIVIYVLGTRFMGRLLRKKLTQSLFVVPVKVTFGDSVIEVPALIDTGNRLQDPISSTPVIVIEYSAIKGLLPKEVRDAFESSTDPDFMHILDAIAQSPWSRRFRVIPFTSLGRENGMLVGFKPDRLMIYSDGIQVSTRNVIIGVYRQELSPEGSYRALLHPDLLELMTAC